MKIIVPVKLVPDLVEELEINEDGNDIDRDLVSYKINEFDDHALEEALQLKDTDGDEITVIAVEGEETDKVLYTAIAKGADRAIKLTGVPEGASSRVLATAMANVIREMEYDIILTGVQAADDREGQLGVRLANELDIPHLSVVSDISVSESTVTAHQEYAGGVMARFQVNGKVLLGIQAARGTPRYAPVSRVRQVQKETELEEVEVGELPGASASTVRRMFTPEKGKGAEMMEGDVDEIAERLAEILNRKRS